MNDDKGNDAQQAIEARWRGLYRFGAIAAFAVLILTVSDIILTMLPGWEQTTTPISIDRWFTQLSTNPWLGLRNLDLLNLIVCLVGIPLYVALFGATKRKDDGLATLSLAIVLVGAAAFIVNNAALPMLALSRQYATATSQSQQLALQGAGFALLAKGAHGSPGVFPGFILSNLGTLLISWVMLRSRAFSRLSGWLGLAGTSLLMVYLVGNTFWPGHSDILTPLAMLGGLPMLAWDALVARRLWTLPRDLA